MPAPRVHDPQTFRRCLRLGIVLVLLVAAVSVIGNRGLLRLYQMHRTRAALAQEIEQRKAAIAALAEEVRALRTDPGRVEAIAREELGLVKPGEFVYEFRNSPPPPAPAEVR